jgi:hypothetical protein
LATCSFTGTKSRPIAPCLFLALALVLAFSVMASADYSLAISQYDSKDVGFEIKAVGHSITVAQAAGKVAQALLTYETSDASNASNISASLETPLPDGVTLSVEAEYDGGTGSGTPEGLVLLNTTGEELIVTDIPSEGPFNMLLTYQFEIKNVSLLAAGQYPTVKVEYTLREQE